ncbi:MAG: DUF6259 domain-containing protein [Verrucomicrobiae bacterium]|nr:DUF6259 domain-containing protein [Verrucomicrobiae bacterium]
MKTFFICSLLIFAMAGYGTGAETYSFPFPLLSKKGADGSPHIHLGGGFVQKEGEALWIEAEDATMPGRSKIEESPSGGGICLGGVLAAGYDFFLTKGGHYAVWARMYFGDSQLNWPHSQHMDDGPLEKLGTDVAPAMKGKWVWVKLGGYDLKAGIHRFALDAWPGQARIDKLLVTPGRDFLPKESGQPGMSKSQCPAGELATLDFWPCAVEKWEKLEVDANLNGGSVRISCSNDCGKNWRMLPEQGGLEMVAVRNDGRDKIRFKLEVGASADGKSPVIRGLKLHYDAGGEKNHLVALSGSTMEIQFDRRTGIVRKIRHPGGAVFLHEELAGYPFELFEWDQGGRRIVRLPDPPECDLTAASSEHLRFQYRWPDRRLAVDCEARMVQDGSIWRIGVDNLTERRITAVTYPSLGFRVGRESRDDTLIYPRICGDCIQDPSSQGKISFVYPAQCSMQWMDLCDEKDGGVYFSSHDRTTQLTTIESQPFPEFAPGFVKLSFTKHIAIEPKSQWWSQDYFVGLHSGDWHWGADRYRAWAETWMKKPDTPAWLRQSMGWMGWMLQEKKGGFSSQMGGALKAGVELDLDPIQFWGQMLKDKDGRHGGNEASYLPDLDYGGEKEFMDTVGNLRASGKHAGFYIAPNICEYWGFAILPQYQGKLPPGIPIPDWEGGYKDFATRDHKGNLSLGQMCPWAEGWRKYVHFWSIEKYIREYKVSGLYYDTLGCTAVANCFDSQLHHDGRLHVGTGGQGYLEMVRQVREAGRSADKDFYLAEEGVSDVYGQYIDLHLISPCGAGGSAWWKKPFPEMFRYTFPDYLLMDGFCNRQGKKACPGMLDAEQTVRNVFLMGHRFDLLQQWVLSPSSPDYKGLDYLKQTLRLRSRINDLFARARFRDTVGLKVGSDRVRAKLFQYKNEKGRGCIVTVANPRNVRDEEITVDEPEVGGLENVFAFTVDGAFKKLEFSRRGGRVVFAAPESSLSAVLLPDRGIPLLLTFGSRISQPGENVTLPVSVDNIAGERRTIGLEFEMPEGVQLIAASLGETKLALSREHGNRPGLKLELEKGQSAGIHLELKLTPGISPGCHSIKAIAKIAGETVAAREARWLIGH